MPIQCWLPKWLTS